MRKTFIAGAILSALTLLSGNANAVNEGTVVGTGTISPGLPASGCAFQTVSFSGTAIVASDDPDTAGVYNLAFNGTSNICETATSGQGTGTLSGGITGSVSYSRTASVVTVNGTVQIGGGPPGNIFTAQCKFAPTGTPPHTSYALVCKVIIL